MGTRLEKIINKLRESYKNQRGINYKDDCNLPSRSSVIRILQDIENLIFPGFRLESEIEHRSLRFSIQEHSARLLKNLITETAKSLAFKERLENQSDNICTSPAEHMEKAEELAYAFLEALPEIRQLILEDVAATQEGDPAAKSQEEVILSYPGVEALAVHRVANYLWNRQIPLIPRMMSEYIHGKTGIDIHPGATIGKRLCIDHGTGVVIGETTIIGDNVKIYQGVTLGALSVKKTEADTKRHPTIEDNVTIYAGATILGGTTVIGHDSIIGGNVWLTSSVPPHSKIYNQPSKYIIKPGKEDPHDFQI
ncbi:serine O-acetyltransferase EpsC [Spirochaetia bacterium 38H-sp]|uniref:Serine acetyltransferase n=1 Tax=Rarispira pelagica TaxID=3141764 RepID=A0ABU9U9S0_9SPIR